MAITQVQHPWNLRSELLLLVIGLCALLLGLFMYIATRPCQQILFLQYLPLGQVSLPLAGIPMIHSVPSFLHVYGFILLTVAVLPKRSSYLRSICLFWLVLELFFEIGQQHDLALQITGHLPAWFYNSGWLLKVIPNYFLYGTFDPLDVVFLLLGVAAAWGTVMLGRRLAT